MKNNATNNDESLRDLNSSKGAKATNAQKQALSLGRENAGTGYPNIIPRVNEKMNDNFLPSSRPSASPNIVEAQKTNFSQQKKTLPSRPSFSTGGAGNKRKFDGFGKSFQTNQPVRRRVLSITQILAKYRKKQTRKKRQKKLIRPLIPPKSLLVITTFLKAEKSVFNRRIIDYKNAGLLQKYIGIGGKILPRLQTGLTSKQQRYVAKTIKSARIMGLLPFVGKERGFFR
uniref:Small ribosomal subunit protein bS18c n=1 Tax=Staurocarteria cerasiformis TaxID=69401 RepID=A0A0S2LQ71_STACE|nr:ribosomal protein S18 [Carteria cerasiformis]ALO63458.1 ribosomal protein S18 [Carteria cerasiformis]